MDQIVINDTNILIDLTNIGLADAFFRLPYSFHTIDLVLNELTDTQQHNAIMKYVNNGSLNIKSYSENELINAALYHQEFHGNPSFIDTTLIKYTQETGGILLTGDNRMRKQAEEKNVTVRGVLFVFDKLVECEIVTEENAAIYLEKLMTTNRRLPHGECMSRIEKWSNTD